MKNDNTNYEELADRAARGDLKPGRVVYRGDGSEIDLASVFAPTGQPRTDESESARTGDALK